MSSQQFENILIEQGLIKHEELIDLQKQMKSTQLSLVTTLLTQGRVKEPSLLKALEKYFEIPAVDLKHYEIDPIALEMIPRDVCEKYCLIPLQKAGATLLVAFSDPRQKNVIEELRQLSKCRIQALVCTDLTIAQNIVRYYSRQGTQKISSQSELKAIDSNINKNHFEQGQNQSAHFQDLQILFQEAVKNQAQVIDFDLTQAKPVIHLRKEQKRFLFPHELTSNSLEILERIGRIAKIDLQNKADIQTSDFGYLIPAQGEIHCRLFILPQVDGFHMQLQLKDNKTELLSLDQLGLDDDELRFIRSLIKTQQGLLLISGLANSGMYSLQSAILQELKLQMLKTVSIESKSTMRIAGISQFFEADQAQRLQLIKRMNEIDLDVLHLADILSFEELNLLFRFVYDGHFTIAGIRSSDAASALTKMIEMGIPPFIVNSLVFAVVGIRKLNRICEQCRVQVSVPQVNLIQLGVPQNELADFRVFKGRGCANCQGTGVKGHISVIEVLNLNEKIREAILRGANAGQIRYLAREAGMKSLRKNILSKINKGLTTIDELHFATTKEI